jgi:hypothetical protein
MATKASQDLRAVAWALVLGALVIGWFFILWQNKFHATAPVVMLCLGYLAVVATVANLWRVGAAAVAPEDATVEAWARPLGERDELEKEKRTLLKAIKEAEFDHAMGKLSKADSDQLIAMYRGRAIAVIKELERLDGIAAAADTRGQIEREVAARLALEGGNKKKNKAAKAAAKAEAKAKADAKAKAEKPAKFAAPPKAKPADASDDDDDDDDDEDDEADEADDQADAANAANAVTAADLAAAEAAPKRPTRPSQRSFTTSDEGDKTPLPPPTSHADVEDSKPGDAVVTSTDTAAKSDTAAKADKFADPPKPDDAKSKGSKEASS